MADVRATTFRFPAREAPDAAAYVQRSVTVSPYQHEARVLVHAPAEVVRERVPPTVGTVEAVDDATCRVIAGGNNLEGLAWHFGSLGHAFTVESPDELREATAAFGARLLAAAVAGGP